MRNTSTFHPEPLQRPIARGDSPHKTRSNMITLELHRVPGIKLIRARGLLKDFVD